MGIAQSEGTSKSHRLQKQAERTEAIHWKHDTLEMLKPIFVGTTDACPIGSPKKSLSTWIRMSLGRFSNSFLKSTSGTKVRWVQEKTFLPETRQWTPRRCKKALFNQCGSRQHYAIKCSAIQSQSGAAKSVLPILCWCCLVFPPDEPKTSHLEEKLTPLTASGTNQRRKFCDDECKATYCRKE